MTEQLLPFDAVYSPELAQELKERGMAQAILKNDGERVKMLELARHIARSYARTHGRVTADDVREVMCGRQTTPSDIGLGYHWRELGNAAGSIFRGNEWECIGWEKSGFDTRHGNRIGVYRWKGNVECR